jgi:hypothetical protein
MVGRAGAMELVSAPARAGAAVASKRARTQSTAPHVLVGRGGVEVCLSGLELLLIYIITRETPRW